MIITITGPKFFWTLNVSHHSPNWLSMTHTSLNETPFTEFNIIFGQAYKLISNAIFRLPMEAILGIDIKEMTAGRDRYSNWGKYQAVQSMEAMVMGHPGSMILAMFDNYGLKPAGYWVGSGKNRYWHQCQTYGCLEEQNTDIGEGIRVASRTNSNISTKKKRKLGGSYLQKFSEGIYGTEIFKIFNIKKIHDRLANFKKLDLFFRKFGLIFDQAAASVGARFDRVFCPMDIAPFVPYYLSGIDAYAWRSGYPITDPEKSKIILNPISNDVIGTTTRDVIRIGKKTITLPPITEKWGNIYPRDGTVNIDNSAKAAAIVALRSNSVLTDESRSATRIYRKPKMNTLGAWNKIIPPIRTTTPGAKVSACHKNIANTGTFVHSNSTYAYTSWPKYRCDLASGITIARINFSKCLTDEIPE